MMSGSRRPSFATERIIGASHVRTGKPCQDDVGVFCVGDIVVVAVADGHGTSKHADVGARLAVQVALETLAKFAEELDRRVSSLTDIHRLAEHPLRVHLVREWASRVRAKAGHEETPLIDYGSTLLFALTTPEFVLIGQLGDGDILLVDGEGHVEVPIPTDAAVFADETPSLCLRDAWHAMHIRVLPTPQEETLLLLSTDGYSKSYASDAVFRKIGPDYLELVRSSGLQGLAPHLHGFLEEVTTRGSGDDIAIALLHWPPRSVTEENTVNDLKSIAAEILPPSSAREEEPMLAAAPGTTAGPDVLKISTQVDILAASSTSVTREDTSSKPPVELEKVDERTTKNS